MNQEVSGLEESAETQHLPQTGIKLVETFAEWMAPFLNDESTPKQRAHAFRQLHAFDDPIDTVTML